MTELQSLSSGEAFNAISDVVVASLITILCTVIRRGKLNAGVIRHHIAMVTDGEVLKCVRQAFFTFSVSVSGKINDDCMFRFL